MTVDALTLPPFLSDLALTLDGRPLAAHPVPPPHAPGRREGYVMFGFGTPKYWRRGLSVDLKAEVGRDQTSCTVDFYSNGEVSHHTQWDDSESGPSTYEAGPFEEWVRGRVLEGIVEAYGEHLSKLTNRPLVGDHRVACLAFCEDCAVLAELPDLPYSGVAAGLRLLGSVPATLEDDADGRLPGETLARYEEARSTSYLSPSEKEVLSQCLELATSLARSPGGPLLEQLRADVDAVFAKAVPDETAEVHVHGFRHFAATLAKKPPVWREMAVPRLLALCRTSALTLAAAEAFAGSREDARRFLLHGLSLDDVGTAFLQYAATFFAEDEDEERWEAVETRLAGATAPAASPEEVEAWTARYTELWEDYRWFRPKSDTDATGPELLALETRINAHFRSVLPPEDSPLRPAAEAELCDLGSFQSKGSARYVGWLRERQRYQEVVDLVRPLVGDLDGCVLRHRSSGWDFEDLLWRGLSCFLDSQEPAHIAQGQAVVVALGTRITGWHNPTVLYTFACLAARAQEPAQALHFLRWMMVSDAHEGHPRELDLSWLREPEGRDARVVELGGAKVADRLWEVRRDSDFRHLWDHPGLKALEDAAAARS